jgi:lipid A ethanolaminephosphotransferase
MVGEVIDLLKQLQDRYTTAMLYVSDHGESLGESGLFLHGMPYAFAPIEQKQVPMYVWTSPSFMASNHIDTACMKAQTQIQRSHDHVYASILGMLNIATAEYHPELDLLSPCMTTRHTDPKGASPRAASAK